MMNVNCFKTLTIFIVIGHLFSLSNQNFSFYTHTKTTQLSFLFALESYINEELIGKFSEMRNMCNYSLMLSTEEEREREIE
jgi:Na+/H+ antiporter NhaC